MPRGNSPVGSGLPEEDPPRISNKKKILIIDLVKLVKDQKTRKGLDYVKQAVEQIKENLKSNPEIPGFSQAITYKNNELPENLKKEPWELPLSDVIMYLGRRDEFDKTTNDATVGVLIGLIIYTSVTGVYDNETIQSIMAKIRGKLGEDPKIQDLYDSGITSDLMKNFSDYLDNLNNPALQRYFSSLKLLLLSTENVKSIADSATQRERIAARIEQIKNIEASRVVAGIGMAKRVSAIRNSGSLTSNKNNNCKESGSCVISGGKRKIRKSRKAFKKSRKTRRRK